MMKKVEKYGQKSEFGTSNQFYFPQSIYLGSTIAVRDFTSVIIIVPWKTEKNWGFRNVTVSELIDSNFAD